MISRSAKGRAAEELVAASLADRGWDIVARNWRGGRGELDIVALKDGVLAVVEVKDVGAYGLESLESSVGRVKRLRIVETSKLFVSAHREFSNAVVRYDVATVAAGTAADYFENAFAERT
ncbi:MAG: YraN family protein [Spirochaetes bacterium]|nr:YraN family protein [Spirochaetota bacterium]MBU1079129.1 YraN family protein [Spirochaetota bacterium]